MKINPLKSTLIGLSNSKNMQRLVNWASKDTGKINKFSQPVSNLEIIKKHVPPALTVLLSSLFFCKYTEF